MDFTLHLISNLRGQEYFLKSDRDTCMQIGQLCMQPTSTDITPRFETMRVLDPSGEIVVIINNSQGGLIDTPSNPIM